ncbi:PRA1 family protein [Sarocladium implicatum]|nr:PRA1 family protein [Sarocladium implicatum]
MARIQIPLDVLTSRINLQDRFQSFRSGPLSGRFANLRPISEFFDMKRLSKPNGFSECQSRINYNLSYFSTNYIVVMAMLSIYALLTNLVLLFDIILIVAGLFIIGRLEGRDLEIGTFRATTSQLYTGLLVVTVPVGLWASPIATMLWLIAHRRGFFRGGGLGGRPRAPEFAPPWGRPSRRRRRRTDGDTASYEHWGGDPRVQELDSEGDFSDAHGVGLSSSRRGTRFVSDSLQFTGVDLGDRSGSTSRRRYFQGDSDDDDDDGSSSEDDDGADLSRLSPKDKEEVLVQSAMRRIDSAREKGKTDVKLNKDELAALERRRKRMQEEAEKERKKKKKKGSGSSSDRKKSKEQRIAVPLSRLDPVSRKKKSSPPSSRESPSSSRRPSATDLTKAQQEGQVYPPMGYFPPPSGRSRPRSGTSMSQRPPSRMLDERAPSPLNYDNGYRPSSASRHLSEGTARPPSRGMYPDQYYGWDYSPPSSAGSRDGPDPFQYQTAGPRAPYAASSTGAAAASSRRHVSGPPESSYMMPRRGQSMMAGPPAAVRGRHSLPARGGASSATDSQSSEEDSTSDELGHGAQIREPPPPLPIPRGREDIVVEVSPDRAREGGSSKKKSSSPSKRKPVPSGGGRSRRKR